MINLLSGDHDHAHEDHSLFDFFKDQIAHNIVGLWGLVFAVVLIASVITYKYSAKTNDKKLGVLGGALLGLIPGCGGTVAVTSMYAKKKASFAAVLAAFVATLGEGSFILMSEPKVFLIVTVVGFVVALIAGYAIQYFKVEQYFGEPKVKSIKVATPKSKNLAKNKFATDLIKVYLFYPLMVIGTIFIPISLLTVISETMEGAEVHFFFDAHEFMHNSIVVWVSIITTILAAIYWIGYGFIYKYQTCACKNDFKQSLVHGLRDATMIMSIITIATLITGVVIDYMIGMEHLEEFIIGWGVLLVVIAAVVGAIPGCAPYIVIIGVVLGLHDHHEHHSIDHDHHDLEILWGVLIAGGIATSGDGFFGLLAVSKEKAGLVTLFSIILAIVVGVPIHLIFN